MQRTTLGRVFLALALLTILLPAGVRASASLDSANGVYADDLSDATGLSSKANADVDPSSGKLQLTNAQGGFTGPYNASGYAVTRAIVPVSVARWGTVTFTAAVPAGTSVRIQVLDESRVVYGDALLAGNSSGFATTPIDISALPVTRIAGNNDAKFARITFRLALSTSDPSLTPTVDDISLTWTVKRGDLTPSPVAKTAWAGPNVDNRATNHTAAAMDPAYPALYWAKDIGASYGGPFVRGSGDAIYYKSQGGPLSWPWVTDGFLAALNRDTGATIWNTTLSGYAFTNPDFTLSENGTIYNSDIYSDIFLAFDAADGSLKWTYQFYNGHGNTEAIIADDGTLYTIRSDDHSVTVYAFTPDGSTKWSQTLAPSGTNMVRPDPISLGDDGTIYFTTAVSDSNGNDLNQGSLYALDPATGATKWAYPAGDWFFAPVVDADGTVYVANSASTELPKAITAVNPDGSLKWIHSIGTTTQSWSHLSLGSNGLLLAVRSAGPYPTVGGEVDAINTTDGSLAWSAPFDDDQSVSTTAFFSDGSNGFYRSGVLYNASTSFSYCDAAGKLKWALGSSGGDSRFTYAMQDESGRVYGNLYRSGLATLFALRPWTLAAATDRASAIAGTAIMFTATTSMQTDNALTGGPNYLQVVMDNGDTVPLSYSSTDSSRDTVWTGSYTIPTTTTPGTHAYAVEANAAGIETDTQVHFTAPAAGSNNTGIVLSSTIAIQSAPTDDPNPPAPEPAASRASHSGSFTAQAHQALLDPGANDALTASTTDQTQELLIASLTQQLIELQKQLAALFERFIEVCKARAA